MDTTDQESDTSSEASLLSHLFELRSRLLRISVAVLVLFLVLIPFKEQLFRFVALPLIEQLPEQSTMIATQVASPLLTPFKTTLFVALFFAMPVVIYQVWAFVAPGLYKKEKHFAFPLLATSIVLFYVGLAFAYFVVFPLIFKFVVAFTPESVSYMPDITDYIGFVMMLVLVFGLAFETPVATVLLVWTGITTVEKLGTARPYVFLGAFVVGMLLTPPDVISQIMLAIPVYLLFELGIIMAKLFKSRPVK